MKPVLLSLMLLASIASGVLAAEPDRDARELARLSYERAMRLRSQIAVGWAPADVARIMGDPEAITRRTEGTDAVETWWYQGYEIGVEFRNGAASNWFFRFTK
jgi:hypothetical protein